MKTLSTIFIFLICFAGKEIFLMDKPVPNFSGLTLDNKKIDSTFFKGKVTLLNFWAIGCKPCMKELPFLQELDSSFQKQAFHILSVAPHSREKLLAFNSGKPSQYSNFRKAIGADIIRVNVLPECMTSLKNKDDNNHHLTLLHDCEAISNLFNVDAYPTTFIIDKAGIIRKIHFGYPMEQSDSEFKTQIVSEIEKLLK